MVDFIPKNIENDHNLKKKILFEDTKEFKEIIEKCKIQDPIALEEFFELYSIEIYNFPIKIFRFNEEDAGDFFLFAFERLRDGKRFRSFRGESSFKTWFYSVLRNLVLDWIRFNKKTKLIQFYHVPSISEVENQILEELKNKDEVESKLVEELFYRVMDEFDEEERIVFKLVYIFYLNLDENDVKILKDKYKKTNYEIFDFISYLKEYLVNKNIKLKQKSERLNRMYLKLLKLKERKKVIEDKNQNESIEELEDLETKIQKKIQHRDKMLENKNPETAILKVPFHKIAKFLNLSTPTVSSIYKKAENKIKNAQELKKIFTNEHF
jgi:RNA polymerase sigma factor (sigma-70 family)